MEILSLGEKIKQKRKEKNLTLKELAGDKVTPGQISLVESGKSKPSLDLLEYIAERLDVSIDYILETEKHQAERLCELYLSVADASLMSGNIDQSRESIDKAMAYAAEYKLYFYIGLNEFYKGKIEFVLCNYEKAQERFFIANELFLKNGNARNISESYLYLGMCSYHLSYYNSSINYFKQSEKILSINKIIDEEMLMKIYHNISLCYSKLQKYSETVSYALLSMEKFKKTDDKQKYGQSLLLLSTSYSKLNMYDQALIYARKACEVFKSIDKLAFVAQLETNMGVMLSDIDNTDEAFIHLKNAYKIKVEINDKTLPFTMLKLVDNYIKSNNIDKAMEIMNDAYDKCCDDDYKEYRGTIYYYLYRLHMASRDERKAEMYLLEAIKYLQNMDMTHDLADMYILLGEHYENQGNIDEALKCKNKGIEIYKTDGALLKEAW